MMHFDTAGLWRKAAKIPDILSAQLSGIALLTLVPFMISGIIFAPWNTELITALSSSTPYVYSPAVAAVLLVLCIATAAASQNFRFVMCVLSSIVLLAIALKHAGNIWEAEAIAEAAAQNPELPPDPPAGALHAMNGFLDGIDWVVLYTLYTLTGLMTFVVILLQPTMSRWLFRLIVAALLIDLLLSVVAPGTAILGPLFLAYYPSQISVLVCLMVLLTLRMIRKFYAENAETRARIREMDPKFIRYVRRKTLALWWPMPLIFLVCTIAYSLLQDRYVNRPAVEHLNSLGTTEPVEIAGQPVEGLAVADVQPTTVEGASSAAVARLSGAQAARIKAQIDAQVGAAGADKAAVMNGVRSSMPQRFPGTKTESCFFLNIPCHIKNGVKSMINSGYVSAREKMLADLQADLDELERAGKGNAQDMKNAVDENFMLFTDQSQRRISDTATGLRFVGWATFFYAILILVKSYMIVFARVFYWRVSTTPAHRAEGDDVAAAPGKPARSGRMKRVKSQHTIARDDGYSRYYLAFRSCGNNVVDRRRIPQPLSLVLKRLFSRNYVMCLVDLGADNDIDCCDVIVDPPSEIVQWDLTEDDEIYVDMATVIGFSESCRLGSHISLSIASLIFGRAIYHSIAGPGRVFLRTRSAPLAAADKGTDSVMQASSLVAWRRDTEFNVISSRTIWDMFFSGYSIRKAGAATHSVIYDTSQTRRLGAGQGIVRMTRAFLLPF